MKTPVQTFISDIKKVLNSKKKTGEAECHPPDDFNFNHDNPLARADGEPSYWHGMMMFYFDMGDSRSFEDLIFAFFGLDRSFYDQLPKVERSLVKDCIRNSTRGSNVIKMKAAWMWDQRCLREHDIRTERKIELERRLREEQFANALRDLRGIQMQVGTKALAIASMALNELFDNINTNKCTLSVRDIHLLSKLGIEAPNKTMTPTDIKEVSEGFTKMIPEPAKKALFESIKTLE